MGEVVAIASLASPLGRLRLAVTREGVARLELPHSSGSGFRGWLQRHLPDAESVESLPLLERTAREFDEYFSGRRLCFDVPLDLRGTRFQLAVWSALREIPFGETRSYADVARSVSHPHAFRAVGAANGANPIPIIVPCHRVIAADGRLGGYGGGLPSKRRLLAFERQHRPAASLV
ncbi:MAG: methylated-DNA--[protein]-cysteine S-methyltransferase [Myxococcota bacterium]